jgi:hypothetical protein
MYVFRGFGWHAVKPTSLKSLLRSTSREWIHCGDVSDMCWIWICFGYVLDMFWICFGYVLDMFWIWICSVLVMVGDGAD